MSDLVRSARTVLTASACAAGLMVLAGCAAGSGGASDVARWSLVEEVRIGGADDASQTLGDVRALAVDDAGRVYVPQVEQGTIRVFDADGTAVRNIGRRGVGPGQLDRIYGLGFVGDTLYAIDFGQRRVSYFSTEGQLLRTHELTPPPVDPPFYPGMPFAVFGDGSMAVGTAWPATIEFSALRRVPQLRVEAGGETVDTVTWLSYERTGRRADYQGRPLPVGSPFSDDRFAIFSMDGMRLVTIDRTLPAGAEAAAATFGVTVSDGWGDTIYSRRYEYEPVEIAQPVIDRAVADGAQRISGAFPDAGEAQAFVRSQMYLPTHYPPVSTAAFSEDGTLWIRREAIPERPQQWMVLDESGDPVAEATLPAGLRVMVILADDVWGVAGDEAGAPTVVRYGIARE